MDTLLLNRLSGFLTNVGNMAQRGEYEKQNLQRLQAKLGQIEQDKTLLVKAVGLIDRCIEVISANGIGKIQSIVTGGLQLVFGDPTLGIDVEKKEGARGNSYRIVGFQGTVGCKGNPYRRGPLMDTFGGGIVNVVAFLLRLIMVRRFKLAKFLACDEAFNNVAVAHLPKVSELLKKLCKDHGFTILAVTHQPVLALAADHVYKVEPGPVGPTLREILSEDLQHGPAETAQG